MRFVSHTLLAASVSLLGARFVQADNVSWKSPGTGSWTVGSNWSSGSAPGINDRGIIGIAGGYSVTINAGTSGLSVGSLLLNSHAATLLLPQGTFSAINGMQIAAGTFFVNGGTLSNTVLSGVGRVDAWKGGFHNVSLGGAVHVINNYPAAGGGAPFHIGGGLSLNNGLLDVRTSGNDNQWAIAQFDGTQSVTGSGSISLDGTRAARLFLNGGTTTLTSGIQLRGVGTITATNATLVNQGTIEAAPAPAYLRFLSSSWSATPLVNQGTIRAGAGACVYLEQRINNSAGTIQSTGGTVFIGSDNGYAPTFSTATLGTLIPGIGTISLRGNWNNAGRTFSLPSGNAFEMVGTFSGGTLTGTATSAAIHGADVTLRNLAIKELVGVKANVKLESITLDNGTLSLQGADQETAQCQVSAPQPLSLTGTGAVRFDGSFSSNSIAGQITIGSGVKVHTGLSGGTIGSSIATITSNGTIASDAAPLHLQNLVNNGRAISSTWGGLFLDKLTNNGTIASSGATLSFSGTWSNNGTISSVNGGTVLLNTLPSSVGNVSISDSSLWLRASTTTPFLKQFSLSNASVYIEESAAVNHSGQTWDTGLNPLVLSGGTLSGGTVSSSVASDLTILPGKIGWIENVTVKGPARLNVQGIMRGGVTLDQATLSIGSPTGTAAGIDFLGDLNGTGEVILNGTTGTVGIGLPMGTLTLPSGIILRTGTSGGDLGNGNFGVWTNNSTMLVDNPAARVTLSTASFINNSLLRISAGTFDLHANALNNGQLLVDGGVGTLATQITGNGTINIPKGTAFLKTVSQRALNVGSMGSAIFRLPGLPAESESFEEINVAFGGVLDLGNHNVVVNYSGTSPYPAFLAAVKSGYANGVWTGSGINSSAAAQRSTTTTRTAIALVEATELFSSFPANWNGRSIDSTTILMQYALAGDIDLNAKVNTLDFNRFVAFFGSNTTLWTRGDFSYDGHVNSVDFNLLLSNYGRSTPFSSPPIGALAPEPSVAGFFAIIGLLTRRRSFSRLAADRRSAPNRDLPSTVTPLCE